MVVHQTVAPLAVALAGREAHGLPTVDPSLVATVVVSKTITHKQLVHMDHVGVVDGVGDV